MSVSSSFRDAMQRGWHSGIADGTPCGKGSTMANTAAIREWLPGLVERHGIKSVADAGAGDMHWIQHVAWNVDYRPFDLIPRNERVKECDITCELLPQSDLILSRLCLQHLMSAGVLAALEIFRQSGSTYLLSTQHYDEFSGKEDAYNKWDLRNSPFNLGEPIEQTPDVGGARCFLALWRLN